MNGKAEGGRLYERVSRDIAEAIAAGHYEIGQRLPAERNLALHYAVSRPTVREAIIALELDGLVEVRIGSGVYVVACQPRGGKAAPTDVGPFELTEARRAIESETCALAAQRISQETLDDLAGVVAEMQAENERDVVMSEDADRRFHLLVAGASENSALVAAVRMLWDTRARSPQYQLLAAKAHAAGVRPRIEEHAVILEALRTGDPDRARAAMQDHMNHVLESLFEATEVHEMEQARARVAEQRARYSGG
ncbi:FadR/GntR family transcriptional regulator [Sphingomonas quercus]|uniref:FadR family transcriptional regulator n=1 Tax=Sphingomonas quercus TaxID=2842451 RepID=A0ABS6BEA3_9SPHN|nr:FadR/GntR family transcriptional regulator [Sphingomonas quercus]MBU3076650.1 FadR family transcriptional regulator [Sphingomonas quercus]